MFAGQELNIELNMQGEEVVRVLVWMVLSVLNVINSTRSKMA